MTEIQIAWLELIDSWKSWCNIDSTRSYFQYHCKKTESVVYKRADGIKQYGFPGNGRMYPIVEYFVNGTCYKAKKKFRGIKTTQLSGCLLPVKSEVYEDEKGWLHVKTGAIVNLRQLAEQLWPINSKMTVYYNPNNPKKCYVDRPMSNSFASMMFVIMGTVTILSSILVLFSNSAIKDKRYIAEIRQLPVCRYI